ncbi:MAG: hypothetical protein RSD41_03270 [Kiritimatiellia bacterium]
MENLDALLDKIRKDGVETAQAEADALIAKAQESATALLAQAKAEAKLVVEKAKADADRLAQGAEATLRQAARDVIIQLGQEVTALFDRTLGGAVDSALNTQAFVETLVTEAVTAYLQTGDVTLVANPALVATLKARLAEQKNVTVVTDARTGAGFKVRLEGGRVEHDFTADSITASLAALLRPQLAALLKD